MTEQSGKFAGVTDAQRRAAALEHAHHAVRGAVVALHVAAQAERDQAKAQALEQIRTAVDDAARRIGEARK